MYSCLFCHVSFPTLSPELSISHFKKDISNHHCLVFQPFLPFFISVSLRIYRLILVELIPLWYCWFPAIKMVYDFNLFQASFMHFKNIYYTSTTKVIVCFSFYLNVKCKYPHFKLFLVKNRKISSISLNSLISANWLCIFLVHVFDKISCQW